jgi:hypothetical protein
MVAPTTYFLNLSHDNPVKKTRIGIIIMSTGTLLISEVEVYSQLFSFVDRDTFMRYCEHAIGHKTATSAKNTSPGKSNDAATTDEEMDVDSGSESDRTQPEEENEESPMGSPDSDVEEKNSDSEASESEHDPDSDDENVEEPDGSEGNEEKTAGNGEANFAHFDDEEDCDDNGYDEL